MYDPSQTTVVLAIIFGLGFCYLLIWATAKSLITAPQLIFLIPPIAFPFVLTLIPNFVTSLANFLGIYSLVSVVTLFYSFYNLFLLTLIIVALNKIYKNFRLFVIEESVNKAL
jgi:hypothetical protein